MTSSAAPDTGDGLYYERLLPSAASWLLAPAGGLVLFLLTWPLHSGLGIAAGTVATIAVALLLWHNSPVLAIELAAGAGYSLRAGNARVPVSHLGSAKDLDSAAMRAAMGPGWNARAYVCQRPWIRTGVLVNVIDDRDPTPYWLLGSRTPAALVSALRGAQAAHSEQTG